MAVQHWLPMSLRALAGVETVSKSSTLFLQEIDKFLSFLFRLFFFPSETSPHLYPPRYARGARREASGAAAPSPCSPLVLYEQYGFHFCSGRLDHLAAPTKDGL